FDLPLHPLGTVAVRLVDDENVGDLHDARLDRLHIVAHARYEHHDGDVGKLHDIDFILSDPDGFHHHKIAATGIENGSNVGGGARQSAKRSAGRHAANKN